MAQCFLGKIYIHVTKKETCFLKQTKKYKKREELLIFCMNWNYHKAYIIRGQVRKIYNCVQVQLVANLEFRERNPRKQANCVQDIANLSLVDGFHI